MPGTARFVDRLAAAGHLGPGWQPGPAADLAWSLTHIDAWRHPASTLC